VLDEMLDIATAVKEFEIPKIPEKCVPNQYPTIFEAN
jgi:hypothetical protein